ncbi:MAG: hypothetical protein SGBAC_011947, partial [Bacillariaceae sp.]
MTALGYKFSMKLLPVKRPSVSRKPSTNAEAMASKKMDPQQQKAAPTAQATKKRKSGTAAEGTAKRAPRRKSAKAARAPQPKMPPHQGAN